METERDAKNRAYAFILESGLLDEFRQWTEEHAEDDPHRLCIELLENLADKRQTGTGAETETAAVQNTGGDTNPAEGICQLVAGTQAAGGGTGQCPGEQGFVYAPVRETGRNDRQPFDRH